MTSTSVALILCAVIGSVLLDGLPSGRSRSVLHLAVPVLLIAGGAHAVLGGATIDTHLFAGVFLSGGAFSVVAGSIVILCGLVVASRGFSANDRSSAQVPLIALVAAGAACAASSVDLITLVVSLELAAIAAYGLAASGGSDRSGESTIRYVVMGALATVMLVLAVGLVLPELGARADFNQLYALAIATTGRGAVWQVVMVLIIGALALKSGIAPLHAWAPDVYETSSPRAAAVLAGPYKLAVFIALALFVQFTAPGFTGGEFGWQEGLLGAMGAASILIGSLGALRQRSYARVLGYAGIAQVGYALVALAGHDFGSSVFFALTYAISATATFMAPAAFEIILPRWDGTIESLKGLHARAPFLALGVAVHIASMIGVPPLVGFWAKLRSIATMAVLSPGLSGEPIWVVWGARGLLVTVVVGAVVSVAYYGRILMAMYSADTELDFVSPGVVDGGLKSRMTATGGVVLVLAALVIGLGVAVLVSGFEPLGTALGGLM